MTDIDRGAIGSGDEDRLPWLEAVDDEQEGDGVGLGKLIGLIILALVAIGLVVGGIFWLRERGEGGAAGEGGLIAAPQGDYKVAPDGVTANGMTIDGEGDATFTASEGGNVDSVIDTSTLPEAPVAGSVTAVDAASVRPRALPPSTAPGPKAPPAATLPAPKPKAPPVPGPAPQAKAPTPAPRPAVVPPARTPAAAPVAKPATPPPAAAGGANLRIRIGAFSTQQLANEGWRKLSAQYPGLRGLSHSVESGQSGGNTIYRLYASGPADRAGAVCREMGAGCIR